MSYTWISCTEKDLDKYTPITQAYGICFDDKNNILIIKENDEWGWALPGGTPEQGETLKETLVRELMEEADVTVKKITFYQSRWVAKIDKILDQTIDPAKGKILERKFVQAKDILNWVKWGKAGEEMFKEALFFLR